MNKYIGENRLTYLWGKIKAFVSNAISGKVDKVSSSTDNAIVRFDGSTGAIQNSSATVSDNGSVTVYDLVVHGDNDTNDTRMISSNNATNLVFRVESTAKMVINPSRITTGTGQTVDLGSSSIPWNNVYGASFITSGGTSSQFVKGDGSLDNNAYAGAQTSGGAANKAVSIPFGQVDNTSTSTAFTATVDGITELRDGVCVYLKNGVVTSAANCTLNVNGLGAKRILYTMAAASAVTTQWNINYTMLFIYNSTRMEGGCWDMFFGYYADANSIGYQLRTNNYTLPASDTSRYYKIFFTSADNTKWVPASVDSTNNATSARPVNQRPINPFGAIVYTTANTNFTAGTSLGSATTWQQYPVALGYSFNRTGAALTLTTGKPVFIKCAPQYDGSAIIDADVPYVQDLPTTEDGKIYIFLGVAYSATLVELQMVHPVYYYKNGAINLWTGTGTQTDVSKSTESNVIDIGEYDLMKINEVKGKSLVMNQHSKVDYTDSYTTAWSGTTYYNGTTHRDNVDTTHKYFVRVRLSAESVEEGSLSMTPYIYGNDASFVITINTTTKYAETKRIVQPYGAAAYYYITGTSFRGTNVRKQLEHIDLTQMFGAGNEPTTVEEVEAILGNDYYEYNTGEVVGNNVEKLDVYDSNDTKKGSLALNLTELTGKVKTLVWMQEALPFSQWTTRSTVSGASVVHEDGTLDLYYVSNSWNNLMGAECSFIAGHKYYIKFSGTRFDFASTIVTRDTSGWVQVDIIGTISANSPTLKTIFIPTTSVDGVAFRLDRDTTKTSSNYNTFNPLNVFDLTQIFGEGNEPTVEEFDALFPNEYYQYNAGEVNSDDISGIIFPDGLHGVGTAYDSLIVDDDGYARRAVKRMRSVDLGSCTITSGIPIGATSYVHVSVDGLDTASVGTATLNALCSSSKFTIGTQARLTQTKYQISRNNNTGKSLLITYDNTEYDFSTFKSSLSGVYLDFELSTPIEYVLDTPVQCVAKVYPNGTVKQVPVMPDSTPMVMDVTYLRDNALYATKEYVNDAIADKADSATTLAGYGITDAKIENGVITLGSNSVTPITSHQDVSGKVDKVSSPTDNAIVRFDGSTGAIQNSSATVSDNGSVTVYDLVVHGDNDTNDTRMISSSNATNLVFRVESTAKMVINPSRITTGTGQTVDLGSSSIPWNNVYGASFITSGGTSSQFVKGDGSLDSNTYATKSYVDNIVGDIETILASI